MLIKLLCIIATTFFTFPASAMLARAASYSRGLQTPHIPHTSRNSYAQSSTLRSLTPLVAKRSSFSASIAANPQLQDIDKQLLDAQMKKILAKRRSMAWKTSEALIVPTLIAPTIAAYYLSAACLFGAFLSAPGWGPDVGWEGTFAVMGSVSAHLASRKALAAEEKLIVYIEEKCYSHDKQVTAAQEAIESLYKQRKKLLGQIKDL